MKTLLDDRFTPTTNEIGFIHAPLDEVVEACVEWVLPGHEMRTTPLDGALADALPLLQPMSSYGRQRILLVAVGDAWTAYFDCGRDGSDPFIPLSALGSRTHCDRLLTKVWPYIDKRQTEQRTMGGVVFHWFDAAGETKRIIYLSEDRPRWDFYTDGEVQPFEEADRYERRRKRDKFDSHMLERYCQAIGIDIFNPDAYGPRSVLVESGPEREGYISPAWEPVFTQWERAVSRAVAAGLEPPPRPVIEPPRPPEVLTLEEAQAWMGVQPGLASQLPG